MDQTLVLQKTNLKSRQYLQTKSHFHSQHTLTFMMKKEINSQFQFLEQLTTHFSLAFHSFKETQMNTDLKSQMESQYESFRMHHQTKKKVLEKVEEV